MGTVTDDTPITIWDRFEVFWVYEDTTIKSFQQSTVLRKSTVLDKLKKCGKFFQDVTALVDYNCGCKLKEYFSTALCKNEERIVLNFIATLACVGRFVLYRISAI